MSNKESLRKQIDRLAFFILSSVPGEPSRSEGAVDCAIRIMREQQVRMKEPGLAVGGEGG